VQFGAPMLPYEAFEDSQAMIEYVQLLERFGFSYVNFGDHVAFPLEQEELMGRDWPDPIVLAAYLAQATTSLRFHFHVLVVPQRNPLVLAKQLATLDQVSAGRVGVGVGAGWLESEFRLLGADFDNRVKVAEEYVHVLRSLWTTDPASYLGEIVAFENVSFHPKPTQRPHPPIYIGGRAKTSSRRALRLGDGWMPQASSDEDFEAGLNVLRAEATATGRSLDGFAIGRHLPFHDRGAIANRHSRAAGGAPMSELAGDPDATLEFIRSAEQMGVTHLVVGLNERIDARREGAEAFASTVLTRWKDEQH
jgi:probable F420-dependent oxidoreductase